MTIREGEDIDEYFFEKDWIGRGKIYDQTKLPAFVTIAKSKVLEIPQSLAIPFPKATLSVEDFLTYDLPRVSAELISIKTDLWFSIDPPKTLVDNAILSRWIPSLEFLSQLEKSFGQAWFNGAKSVVDPRFNEGRDRLPLWIITYWREIAWCKELQSIWVASMSWLDREESKGKTSLELIQNVRQLLGELSWNEKMSYCRGTTSTPELARFLGTAWLSDNHIDMMIEELVNVLEFDPKSKAKIANLSQFAEPIGRIHEKRESQRKKTLLERYEEEVKEGRLEKLYFPLHVSNAHWIAGMIDFKNRTFLFGTYLLTLQKKKLMFDFS